MNFSASVGRASPAALGQKAMVLMVSRDETEARHFLKGLSDRIMDLHHYLAAWHPDSADDDAKLEDLAALAGLEPPGPGTLQVNLSQPARGALLPEAVLKTEDTGEQEQKGEEEEAKPEPEKDKKEEEKKEKEKEKEEAAKAAEAAKKEREAAKPAEVKQPRDKSNMATWALAAVVALALATVVAWPRISSWQEQAMGGVTQGPPDMGPPPEPDASPEEIELSSDSRSSLMTQGRTLMGKKRYKQAIQALEQALYLEDGEDVRRLLAKIHRRTGNVDKAIEHYEYLAQQAPEVAWFPDMIGRLYMQSKDKDAACKAFQKAFEADPTYKPAEKNLKNFCRDEPDKK